MTVTRSCPVCGRTGNYRSDAVADARHPRHSCAKQQQATQMVGRRAERAGQRRERPCPHPRAEHTHGTRAAYVRDRCRCPACTAANTAASRAIYRARAYGRWQPYLDATAVRVHLQALRQAGIGVHRIAALTGTPVSHVRALAGTGPGGRPPVRRVRPQTAQRILALTTSHATPAPGSRVAGTGTRRRLQALIALGWPLPRLAQALGHSTSSLSRTMTAGSVTAATAQQVRHLYHRLTRLSPPQTTPAQRAAADAARAHARQQGWLPPLGWDDIDTDPDPGCAGERPTNADDIDEIAVERAVAGDGIRLVQLTPAEQTEAVRRLTHRGDSLRDIANQLATTTRTVSRRREQLPRTEPPPSATHLARPAPTSRPLLVDHQPAVRRPLMSPAGPDPQPHPDPDIRAATAAHTEPPRALLLTGCPLLADHVRTLDPRVRAAVVHRLAGSAEPALPDSDGLLLLLGPADAHTAASTGLTTITRTLYLTTDPDTAAAAAAARQRATALRAHTVLVLPHADRQLQAEVTDQLGRSPTLPPTGAPPTPRGGRTRPAADPPSGGGAPSAGRPPAPARARGHTGPRR